MLHPQIAEVYEPIQYRRSSVESLNHRPQEMTHDFENGG